MKTLLHVGCGDQTRAGLGAAFNRPGWREIRLDIDPDCYPDIVASMTAMPMISDGSIDAVVAIGCLEHLHAVDADKALQEFRRVLNPTGFVLVVVPDLEAVARRVIAGQLLETVYEAPSGPVTPLDMLYGFLPALAHGMDNMAHRCGFTARTLTDAMLARGFAFALSGTDDEQLLIYAVACRDAADMQAIGKQIFPGRDWVPVERAA